jgi:hypothetical protein
MGEVAVYKNGKYENRIAIPHVWEATLTCMTAIALREPDVLKDMGMEIYTEREEKISQGCSCSSYDVGLSLLLVLLYYYIIFLIARIRK